MRKMFVDLETSGTDPDKNSIIEIAAILVEGNKVISRFEKKCLDPTAPQIDMGALAINKADLLQLSNCDTMKNVIVGFVDWILSHYKSGERIEIAGHNVQFDVSFLKTTLERYNFTGWNSIFTHRTIDTNSVTRPLIDSGLINLEGIPKKGGSLQKLAKALDVSFNEEKLHTAMEDAELCMNVYFRVVELLKGIKNEQQTN